FPIKGYSVVPPDGYRDGTELFLLCCFCSFISNSFKDLIAKPRSGAKADAKLSTISFPTKYFKTFFDLKIQIKSISLIDSTIIFIGFYGGKSPSIAFLIE
ncbi:MAG: hypothetical protein IJ665_08305, partial [Phocaeicola sp.]|nr:hypothetical protein [Phocaeicola sp.]